MLFNTVFLTALAAHVLAAPRESLRVVHERRAVVDPAQGDRLSRDSVIPIRIGLKQSNIDDGYEALMDVSDPKSANYGISTRPSAKEDRILIYIQANTGHLMRSAPTSLHRTKPSKP